MRSGTKREPGVWLKGEAAGVALRTQEGAGGRVIEHGPDGVPALPAVILAQEAHPAGEQVLSSLEVELRAPGGQGAGEGQIALFRPPVVVRLPAEGGHGGEVEGIDGADEGVRLPGTMDLGALRGTLRQGDTPSPVGQHQRVAGGDGELPEQRQGLGNIPAGFQQEPQGQTSIQPGGGWGGTEVSPAASPN